MGGESEAVDHAPVAADIHDVNLAVASRLVELARQRMTALRQQPIVISERAQRHPGRELTYPLPQPIDQHWNRWGDVGSDLEPGLRLAQHQRMAVGVDEARHQLSTRQVALLVVCARQPAAFLQRARPPDAIARDQESLYPGRFGHRQDGATGKDRRPRVEAFGCGCRHPRRGPSCSSIVLAVSPRAAAISARRWPSNQCVSATTLTAAITLPDLSRTRTPIAARPSCTSSAV